MVYESKNQFLIGLSGTCHKDKNNILEFFTLYDNFSPGDIFKIPLNKMVTCFRHENNDCEYILADLPQANSLLSANTNNIITRDFLCFNEVDAVIVASNINNLESNLILLFEIMEIIDNIVLYINEESKPTASIDKNLLEYVLGIPVIFSSSINSRSIDSLLDILYFKSYNKDIVNNKLLFECNIENIVASFSSDLKIALPNLSSRWLALRIIDNDESFFNSLSTYVDESALSQIENIKHNFPKVLDCNKIRSNFIEKKISKSLELKDKVYTSNSDNSINTNNLISNILTFKIHSINILTLVIVFVLFLSFLYLYIRS